jgi:putative hydrolases of HD superfamily
MDEKTARKLAFIFEADKLKGINRRNRLLNENRAENTAEHSWHSILMAMAFAEEAPAGTDMLKVLKMIALHDIVEIYAGDTFFYDEKAYVGKFERESEAIEKITNLLPDAEKEEFKSLWFEFENQQTTESVFANAVDQLMPVLLNAENNGLSWTENGVTAEQVRKKMKVIEKASPVLKEVFDSAIQKAIEKKLLQ